MAKVMNLGGCIVVSAYTIKVFVRLCIAWLYRRE